MAAMDDISFQNSFRASSIETRLERDEAIFTWKTSNVRWNMSVCVCGLIEIYRRDKENRENLERDEGLNKQKRSIRREHM